MLEWMRTNDTLLWWLGGLSILTFVGTLMMLPLLVVRIPVEYFAASWRERRAARRRTPAGWIGFVAKNLLGVVLVLAGIIMLILPGQGILTMLIGVMLMDFPGKYTLERSLVSRPRVLRSINWMRAKWGRDPLVIPRCANHPTKAGPGRPRTRRTEPR